MTTRGTKVIPDEYKVHSIFYYPQELGRNFDELLRMIKGFQLFDSRQVAIPANWPENELVKDRVIIPPAADDKHYYREGR